MTPETLEEANDIADAIAEIDDNLSFIQKWKGNPTDYAINITFNDNCIDICDYKTDVVRYLTAKLESRKLELEEEFKRL